MKRVIIFSLAYYPHVGGAEVAIKEVTDRIAPQEIEFHMVTMRFAHSEAKREQIGNVLVHRIGLPALGRLNKAFFQCVAAFKARSLQKKYHYDAVWAVMAHTAGVPAAIFKLLHPKVPYVLTLQEGDPPEYIDKMMRPFWPFFGMAFTSADIVQAISNFLSAWARQRGFNGVLEVIPNGVDINYFSKTHDRFAIRKKLDIRENETVLITSSRLVHKNAVDDVIRAVALLPSTVHFLVLGTGPEEKALKLLANDLHVESRVHFLGYIPHVELPAYLQASTIFVRPSRSEGLGASFMETMAAGVPIIATQEGGIADFLFDSKRNPGKPSTGFAVDKNSPTQIAETVKEAISNPEHTKKVIENAHNLAFEKYDWDLIARDMREKVFQRVFM